MSSGKEKRAGRRRSNSRLSLTRFAWAMVAVALLIGVPAAITGNESIFIWLDVGFCLVLAAVLFIIGVKGCRSHPGRRVPTVQWGNARDTFIVLAAVVAVLSPAVKFFVDLGEAVLGPVARQERECKAAPYVPPAKAPRS